MDSTAADDTSADDTSTADETTVPARGRWPAHGLVADGLALRVWRPEDVDQLVALLADPEMCRWSPTLDAPDPATCAGRVERAMAAEADGLPANFAIVDATDRARVLGSIDWRNDFPHPTFSVLDVGYGVAPGARGHGVASRALRLLTEWLLDPAGGDVHRVQLDHAIENKGSCRTALRAGFPVEGRRPGFLPLRAHPGAPVVRHEVCLHGRIRPDVRPDVRPEST